MSDDDLLSREPITKEPLPPFHAVIFADGETDDVPGLEAALANAPVWVDERLHQPGDPIVISGRRIFLSRWPFPFPPSNRSFPMSGRSMWIDDCRIFIAGCEGMA